MRSILLISLLILSLPAKSQSDTRMVGFGTGLNVNTILDEYLSPFQYRGNGYMFQVSLDEQNDRFYNHLALIYQKSEGSPDIENNSVSQQYSGNIDWIRAYHLNVKSLKWDIYLGFHILTSYTGISHNRWNNNSYSHNLAFNLGPSLVMDYALWEKAIHLTWEVSVSILNYIIRPSQGSIVPDGAIKRSRYDVWGFISGGKITSIHEYQRIYSNLFVSYRISTRLSARAGYQWDFQNYTVNNQFQSANHQVYIALHYHFRK
jgi:hypothetical protein